MNPNTGPGPRPGRGIAFQLAAVALVAVSALAATGLARWLRPRADVARAAPQFPGRLFKGWEKPDLVLVLSGQQHGYLQPCGCSSPQVGGLERRYNLIRMLRDDAGWPVVAVDLGDLAQRTGPAGLPNQQALIKYDYSMRAMKAMGYSAVGFGEHEVNLGLFDVLARYALNERQPRVVATNLMNADENFPDMVAAWQPVDVKAAGLRVGVVAITDPTVAARIKALTRNDPKIRFAQTEGTLDNVRKQLAASQVDLPVLLYQGPLTRNDLKKPSTGAVACAEAYPEFPVLLCSSEADDPPLRPVEVTTRAGTTSLVVSVGHKGKHIGVVGVWKTGDAKAPYRFRYERVEMSEDFLTPKGQQGEHPIVALMEDYTRQLRDERYLEKYGQVRHQLQVMAEVPDLPRKGEVTYAGSEACKKCHDEAYDIWKKSGHSHAYKTLADAKHPSNRQYDPECIVCHTVGFGYQSGFVTEQKTPGLKDVGCESCHGPASLHVANPTNEEWQRRINPWRHLPKAKRVAAMDQMCQKCHDQDNDVHWLHNGFERKWPKVAHPTPGRTDEDE